MKRKLDANRSRRPGNEICYYFDWELCWHNYCLMLNNIIMTLDCLVKNLSSNRYETQFGCIQRTKVKDQVISYFIFFKCFGSFFLEKKKFNFWLSISHQLYHDDWMHVLYLYFRLFCKFHFLGRFWTDFVQQGLQS